MRRRKDFTLEFFTVCKNARQAFVAFYQNAALASSWFTNVYNPLKQSEQNPAFGIPVALNSMESI